MRFSMRTPPRAFVRDARGGASLELGLGVVALLGIALICFDLYARVTAETSSMRVAATMADYVSRDTETQGPDLVALGEFLYAHELGVPADLVYVISALRRQSAGDAPPEVEVLWSSADIRIGDDLDELAGDCSRYVDAAGSAALPGTFVAGMQAGEVMVVAEVCARLRREGSLTGRFIGGVIYQAMPCRPAIRMRLLPRRCSRREAAPTSSSSWPESRLPSGLARPRGSALRPPREHEDAALDADASPLASKATGTTPRPPDERSRAPRHPVRGRKRPFPETVRAPGAGTAVNPHFMT